MFENLLRSVAGLSSLDDAQVSAGFTSPTRVLALGEIALHL